MAGARTYAVHTHNRVVCCHRHSHMCSFMAWYRTDATLGFPCLAGGLLAPLLLQLPALLLLVPPLLPLPPKSSPSWACCDGLSSLVRRRAGRSLRGMRRHPVLSVSLLLPPESLPWCCCWDGRSSLVRRTGSRGFLRGMRSVALWSVLLLLLVIEVVGMLLLLLPPLGLSTFWSFCG